MSDDEVLMKPQGRCLWCRRHRFMTAFLTVDLFYVADAATQTFDKHDIRAASVGKKYNASAGDIQFDIPFFNMRAEGITDNDDDQSVNIEENLFGQKLFPRIRDLQLLDTVGDTGTAKVMLEMDDRNYVFFEVETVLIDIKFEEEDM